MDIMRMSDEEIFEKYNAVVANVNTQAQAFWLAEISRRNNDRQTKKIPLAAWLTLVATIGALIIAVIALNK